MRLLAGWLFYVGLGALCAALIYAWFGPLVTAAYLGAGIGSVQWRANRAEAM